MGEREVCYSIRLLVFEVVFLYRRVHDGFTLCLTGGKHSHAESFYFGSIRQIMHKLLN